MMLQGCLDGLDIAKLPIFEVNKNLIHLLPDAKNPQENLLCN